MRTFRGGVHPPERKELSKDAPIERLPLPEVLYIPLSQHTGAPAKPLVKKKDKVKRGTKIGEIQGFISANVHSPVSGTVKGIGPWYHPLGKKQDVVIIEVEGDEPEEGVGEERDVDKLSKEELVEAVKEAGIVGLGGAAFPTHVKLSPPKPIDTVILNGAECEPYLTSDYRIMMEMPEKVIEGARIIKRILEPERVIVGIEDNKPDAAERIKEVAARENWIEVVLLKTKYPQGSEKQLIYALTGRQVPSGGLPFDVGVLVQNVGTCVAIYEAVRYKKPLYERVVTVTGGVNEPKNLMVPIGTPVKNLIDYAGGAKGEIGKVIFGGPMMGLAQLSLDVPVIKGTSGVLVQLKQEVFAGEERGCIRCASCVDVCPMGLVPVMMANVIEAGKHEMAEKLGVLDCIECGCCAYVCPTKRNLVQYFKYAKREIIKKKKKG